jgi:hypothetical protein
MFLAGVNTNYVGPSMRVQAEEARSANGSGKSEGRIVPAQPLVRAGASKLGNASGGKAVEPACGSIWALSGHCAGTAVVT